MTIQKFLHSCISLTSKGSTIVIDPGEFSSEKALKAAGIAFCPLTPHETLEV